MPCSASEGVLVGSDGNSEWLLPWWWKHYARYNALPVAFANFGMSREMKAWCRERGELISVPPPEAPIAGKGAFSARTVRRWESTYSHSPKVWGVRNAWFQKPRAFLRSPFSLTLWVDLDCEVCGPLQAVFDRFDREKEISLVREMSSPRWTGYNSGVALFKKEAPVLREWEDLCRRAHKKYMGDQNVLSHLIRKGRAAFQELPEEFNWPMYNGYRQGALIYHWVGTWGKEHIQKFGGVHELIGC